MIFAEEPLTKKKYLEGFEIKKSRADDADFNDEADADSDDEADADSDHEADDGEPG